jgi:hypothetical protein
VALVSLASLRQTQTPDVIIDLRPASVQLQPRDHQQHGHPTSTAWSSPVMSLRSDPAQGAQPSAARISAQGVRPRGVASVSSSPRSSFSGLRPRDVASVGPSAAARLISAKTITPSFGRNIITVISLRIKFSPTPAFNFLNKLYVYYRVQVIVFA